MDTTRTALLQIFGVVPILGTYRQASIRHQKARDWATALWWARRGLEAYGDKAAKPEIVTDLQERVAKYEAKLSAPPKPSQKRPSSAATRTTTPATEVLLCQECGRDFERQVTRGRKPKLCPECRGA